MTRAQALEALELPTTATAADVQRAYDALHTDFRIRVDNAPTEKLRERFRERLRGLDRAYAVLSTGAGAADAEEEHLPASGPVRDAQAPPREEPRPAPPPAPAMLLVRSDQDCEVLVEGVDVQTVKLIVHAGPLHRLRLPAGARRLTATGTDGRKRYASAELVAGQVQTVELRFGAAAGSEQATRTHGDGGSPTPAPAKPTRTVTPGELWAMGVMFLLAFVLPFTEGDLFMVVAAGIVGSMSLLLFLAFRAYGKWTAAGRPASGNEGP